MPNNAVGWRAGAIAAVVGEEADLKSHDDLAQPDSLTAKQDP